MPRPEGVFAAAAFLPTVHIALRRAIAVRIALFAALLLRTSLAAAVIRRHPIARDVMPDEHHERRQKEHHEGQEAEEAKEEAGDVAQEVPDSPGTGVPRLGPLRQLSFVQRLS